jgi:hypothetical protein
MGIGRKLLCRLGKLPGVPGNAPPAAMLVCGLLLPAKMDTQQLPSAVLAYSDGIPIQSRNRSCAMSMRIVREGGVHGPTHKSRKYTRRVNRTGGRHGAGLGRWRLRGVLGQYSTTAPIYYRPAHLMMTARDCGASFPPEHQRTISARLSDEKSNDLLCLHT